MGIWRLIALFMGLGFGLVGCGEMSGASENSGNVVGGSLTCEVTFGLGDSGVINALDFEVAYGTDITASVGADGVVDCINVLPDSGVGVTNVNQTLHFAQISRNGFGGPVSLSKCRFIASADPQPSDFTVTTTNASSGFDTLPVPPSVEVTSIDCSSTAVGVSTTTSTTLSCDGIDCAADERCLAGSCVQADRYEIDFSITGDRAIGALQVDVNYLCTLGGIVGSADAAGCKLAPGLNVVAAFNDKDSKGACSRGTLSAALIFPAGIVAPRLLFTCEFEATGRPPETPDFEVAVVAVSDPRGQHIRSATVHASEVRASRLLR
jgi:hypothetical protein